MPTCFCKAETSHMHNPALLREPAEQAVPAAATAPRAARRQEGDGSDPSHRPGSRGPQAAGGLRVCQPWDEGSHALTACRYAPSLFGCFPQLVCSARSPDRNSLFLPSACSPPSSHLWFLHPRSLIPRRWEGDKAVFQIKKYELEMVGCLSPAQIYLSQVMSTSKSRSVLRNDTSQNPLWAVLITQSGNPR